MSSPAGSAPKVSGYSTFGSRTLETGRSNGPKKQGKKAPISFEADSFEVGKLTARSPGSSPTSVPHSGITALTPPTSPARGQTRSGRGPSPDNFCGGTHGSRRRHRYPRWRPKKRGVRWEGEEGNAPHYPYPHSTTINRPNGPFRSGRKSRSPTRAPASSTTILSCSSV